MFVRVTVCAALVVPTVTYPKERLVVDSLAAEAALMAEKPTVQGAERKASALMTARRTAAFGCACCSRVNCVQDASRVCVLCA